jgi:hypothetical protein
VEKKIQNNSIKPIQHYPQWNRNSTSSDIRTLSAGKVVTSRRRRSISFQFCRTTSEFIFTKLRDHLNLRQLCAVESTAKENSNRSIQVFFQSNHINLTVGPLAHILENYLNIFVILVDVRDYFNQTVQFSMHIFYYY